MKEVLNDRDAYIRWCSALLLQGIVSRVEINDLEPRRFVNFATSIALLLSDELEIPVTVMTNIHEYYNKET